MIFCRLTKMDNRDFGPNDPDDPACVNLSTVRLHTKQKIMGDKQSKQRLRAVKGNGGAEGRAKWINKNKQTIDGFRRVWGGLGWAGGSCVVCQFMLLMSFGRLACYQCAARPVS